MTTAVPACSGTGCAGNESRRRRSPSGRDGAAARASGSAAPAGRASGTTSASTPLPASACPACTGEKKVGSGTCTRPRERIARSSASQSGPLSRRLAMRCAPLSSSASANRRMRAAKSSPVQWPPVQRTRTASPAIAGDAGDEAIEGQHVEGRCRVHAPTLVVRGSQAGHGDIAGSAPLRTRKACPAPMSPNISVGWVS